MHRLPAILSIFLPLLAAPLLPTPCHAQDLVLTGAKVYPSPNSAPISNAVIVIHAGTILSVTSKKPAHLPPGATVLDCTGKFVTAGFWN